MYCVYIRNLKRHISVAWQKKKTLPMHGGLVEKAWFSLACSESGMLERLQYPWQHALKSAFHENNRNRWETERERGKEKERERACFLTGPDTNFYKHPFNFHFYNHSRSRITWCTVINLICLVPVSETHSSQTDSLCFKDSLSTFSRHFLQQSLNHCTSSSFIFFFVNQ